MAFFVEFPTDAAEVRIRLEGRTLIGVVISKFAVLGIETSPKKVLETWSLDSEQIFNSNNL